MQQLSHGAILDDVQFELYDCDEDGMIVKRQYQGAWLLVDNGYLSHSTTVPPIKSTNRRSKIRFSAWLESMRKDVECTFGILKGRWRILKTGIRLFGVKAADEIFLTCCALHNWLLEIDGLDQQWEHGVPSYWEGCDGNEDNSIATSGTDGGCPDALLRLRHPAHVRNYDLSGMGPGNDAVLTDIPDDDNYDDDECDDGHGECSDNDTPRRVRSMRLDHFRQKLVVHFNIAFQKNELQWPRQLARHQPPATCHLDLR